MRFIRSSSTTMIFKILSMGCGLGISILIGRLMGPGGRGLYGLAMTVIVLSVNFGLFGFAGANTYLVGGDRTHSRAVGTQSLLVGLLGGLAATLAVLAIRHAHPQVFGELRGTILWATLVIVPFFLWGTLFSYAFLGMGRIISFNLFEASQKSMLMATGMVMLLVFHLGLEVFFVVIATGIGMIAAAYIVKYFASAPPGPLYNIRLIPRAMSYGVRAYVATLTTFAVMKAGIFFVNYYKGSADAGLYSAAQQMAESLVIIPSVIGTVLFSRIAQGETKHLSAKVMRTLSFLFLPIFAALALGRNLIFTSLFGMEFLPSGQVLLLLLPGTFLLGIEVIMAADIAGRGYPWPAALAWFPILIINVTGYILLIPRYGINGAAFSTSLSFITLFVFMTWYYCRLTGHRPLELFLVHGEDLRIVISAVKTAAFAGNFNASRIESDTKSLPHEAQTEVERVGA